MSVCHWQWRRTGGYEVVGIDTDPSKVTHLNAGRSYIDYIPDAQIVRLRETGRFTARGDFAQISDLDVITILCTHPALGAPRARSLLHHPYRRHDGASSAQRPAGAGIPATYPGTTLMYCAHGWKAPSLSPAKHCS